MSTLTTTNITGVDTLTVNSVAASNSISIGSVSVNSTTVTVGNSAINSTAVYVSGNPVSAYAGMRNRIINGDMRIDQRNAGASGTASAWALDRWGFAGSLTTKGNWQQNAGAVTPPVGFTNYFGFTSSSAYSLLAADYFFFYQKVEGFNIADWAWGSSSASPITLSFWVRSSLSGTFSGSINNNGSTRSYVFTYTINSANTWEYKSIVIPGDTSGTWLTNNGVGLQLNMGFGVGSTQTTSSGSWVSGNYLSATGSQSVVGTNGATFYLTGVQLEQGSVATPFERRPYGQELALCQRYYYKIGPGLGATTNLPSCGFVDSSTSAVITFPFPVTMRVSPTALDQTGTAADYAVRLGPGGATNCSGVPTLNQGTYFGASVTFTVASGLTAGQAIMGRTGSSSGNNAYLGWSAEL